MILTVRREGFLRPFFVLRQLVVQQIDNGRGSSGGGSCYAGATLRMSRRFAGDPRVPSHGATPVVRWNQNQPVLLQRVTSGRRQDLQQILISSGGFLRRGPATAMLVIKTSNRARLAAGHDIKLF